MAFSSESLTLEKNGPVATLWLDRPGKRNALSMELWQSLPAAVKERLMDGAKAR